jgi:hypothetical protein
LVDAADAARTLQKEFSRINKDDRDWIENIKQSELQFLAGEIHDVETTILNLSILLNAAAGRRSRLPPWLEENALKVRDQLFRDLVFGLLGAAEDNGGELTFNKNSETGTLAEALDLLRGHVPPGLVPEPLPVATIQRLKTDSRRLREGPVQEPLPATELERLKADFIRRHS